MIAGLFKKYDSQEPNNIVIVIYIIRQFVNEVKKSLILCFTYFYTVLLACFGFTS